VKILSREQKAKEQAAPGKSPGVVSSLMDASGIEGSTVRRRDGVFVGMVEITGEFFALLSEEEQDRRIFGFASVLNSVPWPVQYVLMVEPADLGAYLAEVDAAAKRVRGTVLGDVALQQAQLAEDLTRDVMAETVIAAVTGPNAADAQTRAQQLASHFSRRGFQAKVCDADRLAQILYLSYSHSGRLQRPGATWMKVAGRVSEAQTKHRAHGRKADEEVIKISDGSEVDVLGPNIASLDQMLAPSALIEQPGYIDLGGVFASTLVAVDYPEQAGNGWLEEILHFSHGSVRRRVSISVEPVPNDRAVGELTRKLVDLGVQANAAARRGRHADVDTELALEDAEGLRQDLARGAQRIFDVTLMVTLMADDLAELRAAVARLKQTGEGFLLHLRETYLEERDAFRATMPLQMGLVRRPRPIPTVPVATCFPFTSGELMHETGDMWGVNALTGNAVIINPRHYTQAHMLFVAATRSGKSMTVKHLGSQSLIRGDEDILVIDPSPPIDYRRWTEAMDGSYLRFGVGSRDRVNPCEIVLPATYNPKAPERMDEELQRPVSQKVAFLKALIEMMAYAGERMPPVERARLEGPLYAMYQEKGITDDWSSVVDEASLLGKPKAKASPTLVDALRHIEQVTELSDLALRLRPFVSGTLDMFSGATNVDLDRRLTVFNVNALVQTGGAHLQAVAYAMVMEVIRSRMAETRRRKFVVIDEAHILFSNKDTARFLASLYRMAGKQGGRVAILTQSITDLVGDPLTGVDVAGEEEARVCLGQTGISFFLRNDKMNDLQLISRVFSLTEAEMRFLADAQPGEGLVVAGGDRALVRVVPTPRLYELATTRPEEVAEIEERQGEEEPVATVVAEEGRPSSAEAPVIALEAVGANSEDEWI